MKIGLLVSEHGLYSHRRLKEAADARGHELRIINLTECFVNISPEDPSVHYRGGEVIADLDAVIPRIEPSITFFGTAVLRQFELLGVFPLNNSLAVLRARDKLRSLQILAKHGIPLPTTGFAHSPQDSQDVIKSVGGAPLIVKLVEGTEGVGVVLAETESAATSVIGAFKQLDANILVQEFIKESSGRDVRCFVIGGKVVAAMERIAQKGEFRANFHLGADVQPVKITPEERAMAVASAKALGLDVAGVDILRSDRGPLVLEINSSPGLEGIEKSSGLDIAGMMIDYIEKNAKPYQKRHTA
ncbi:MAG: 30S ribosomal protein S6--L-glutamate ligase [Alphaproteobacteria bacterium]|nr:30S ribosomal protein S6--L-glutamate ligase [Alphaproteobacteria bacterium]